MADSEITAPKYVSAAERERQARLAAEAAEREGANADNVGVRGLKEMMDGSLEIPVEEEEVMLAIPRPSPSPSPSPAPSPSPSPSPNKASAEAEAAALRAMVSELRAAHEVRTLYLP